MKFLVLLFGLLSGVFAYVGIAFYEYLVLDLFTGLALFILFPLVILFMQMFLYWMINNYGLLSAYHPWRMFALSGAIYLSVVVLSYLFCHSHIMHSIGRLTPYCCLAVVLIILIEECFLLKKSKK